MELVSDRDNEDLLALLQHGGEDGFAIIYRKFWPTMYGAAYQRLKDRQQCQDVVQNNFTDLWHRRQQLTIKNLAGYLLTAVRFQVYEQSLKASANTPFYDAFENLLASPFTADETILNEEMSKLIELWIAALPAKRRKIFLMFYYDQLTTKEIANRLNISQKTVQNQLNTATTYIKAHFSNMLMLVVLLHLLKK